jgi:hypothetical protein
MPYRLGVLAVCLAVFSSPAQFSRSPILVELFTSEGCSSCPPADRLLEQIDSRAVVLSEHVDYWNQQGWADPFSSAELTARQEAYSRRFHLEGPYTPQMVIDGSAEFTGSDASRASRELTAAAKGLKTPVRLARTDHGIRVAIEGGAAGAGVILAIADDSGESSVSAGENRGRRLHHVAIVRSLRKIGRLERGGGFQKEISLPEKTRGQRAIVFVQEGDTGPVSGVAMLPSEKN